MASEPKRSNNFRFNFNLVMAEIARWPVATMILMTALTVATVLLPYESGRPNGTPLSDLDKALLLAGTLLAILGMKGLLLLMDYPRRHKQSFPGSYLATSFIVFVPIFGFYAAGLNTLAGDDFPVFGRVLFLLFSYILFSVFFAGALRMQHAMHALNIKVDEYIRRKWDAVVGRGRKSPPTG
jgi:hypothetical protein